eukprot:SAG22_NODE_3769_length_1537_cov_1.789291_2_plen_219_part_01
MLKCCASPTTGVAQGSRDQQVHDESNPWHFAQSSQQIQAFLADTAAPAPAPEPEPEPLRPDSGFRSYLPAQYDEANTRAGAGAVQFPLYGWQRLLQQVARDLRIGALEVMDNKKKTGQQPVVCLVMQPYHLYREYYIGRMANRQCWATKYFGMADLCERLKMAAFLRSLGPLLGAASPLLRTAPETFVLPEDRALLEGWVQAGGGGGGGGARTMIVKPE